LVADFNTCDDEGYLEWTDRHRTGFVINTFRPPARAYLMLHTGSCRHITTPDHQFSSASWTGNEYAKVCAARRAGILAWSMEQFGVEPSRCQQCRSVAAREGVLKGHRPHAAAAGSDLPSREI